MPQVPTIIGRVATSEQRCDYRSNDDGGKAAICRLHQEIVNYVKDGSALYKYKKERTYI